MNAVRFIFYCLYLGCKTPGRKQRFSLKFSAVQLCWGVAAMYEMLLFLLLLIYVKIFQDGIGFVVLIILVGSMMLCSDICIRRYFSYKRINEIEARYENRVSLTKGRIITLLIVVPILLGVYLIFFVLLR